MTEKRDAVVRILWKDSRKERITKTAKNLIDKAKRFAKEGWERQREIVQTHAQSNVQRMNVEWNTKMKAKLFQVDNEEGKRGRWFMRRVKERWDREYPDKQACKHAKTEIQCSSK